VSARLLSRVSIKGGSPPAGVQLKNVARTFGTLQQQRHIADYDKGFVWQRTDAVAQIDLAGAAFADRRAIRGADEARDLFVRFIPSQASADLTVSDQGNLPEPRIPGLRSV
jgi:hypothetical protein